MKNIEKTEKGFVLAEGEVTGHAHVIIDDIELRELEDEKKQIVAKKEYTIQHEEHKPITRKGGEYEVTKVVEYDHFKEEAKRVID